MQDQHVFERTLRIDGEMTLVVVGYQGYGALIEVKIETTSGFNGSLLFDPDHIPDIANALLGAHNAMITNET
jgi:hypothetical protein